MNTQNTPVHVRLWHKDFWRMSIANLFLTMSVYMLIPTLPLWIITKMSLSHEDAGISMGLFGLGLFTFGFLCSFLVQEYRRNRICILSVFGVLISSAAIFFADRIVDVSNKTEFIFIMRFLQGAFYGLAQMILSSTLIIDTCESFQRTEANHSASWFGRFALSLGPVLALILLPIFGFDVVFLLSILCGVLAIFLIGIIHFPFRTPEDGMKVFSLDRFFLPQGKWLFLNLFLISGVIGLVLSTSLSYNFYAMIMVGFFLSLLTQKFVFAQAELESEVISGLIFIGVAVLMMLTKRLLIVQYLSPLFIGLGTGVIGSRFLLFFIKLSRHCQRGTSQSTFMLGWESGLSAGLFAGYMFMYNSNKYIYTVSLILIMISFLMYHLFTHKWFIKHKNR